MTEKISQLPPDLYLQFEGVYEENTKERFQRGGFWEMGAKTAYFRQKMFWGLKIYNSCLNYESGKSALVESQKYDVELSIKKSPLRADNAKQNVKKNNKKMALLPATLQQLYKQEAANFNFSYSNNDNSTISHITQELFKYAQVRNKQNWTDSLITEFSVLFRIYRLSSKAANTEKTFWLSN